MKRSIIILAAACFAMGIEAHELSPLERGRMAARGINPYYHHDNTRERIQRDADRMDREMHQWQTNERLRRLEFQRNWEWMQRQNLR